jgi:two-component system response regulator QseB
MRVLVVEDDDGIAQGLKAHLRQQGWAVDVTDGVAGAWAALRAEPFDLVLLDLGLADGDGMRRCCASCAPPRKAGCPRPARRC